MWFPVVVFGLPVVICGMPVYVQVENDLPQFQNHFEFHAADQNGFATLQDFQSFSYTKDK